MCLDAVGTTGPMRRQEPSRRVAVAGINLCVMSECAIVAALTSRYAYWLPSAVEHCVEAVSIGTRLEDVIPGWPADFVAVVARDAVDTYDALIAEPRAGRPRTDWTLSILAEMEFQLAEALDARNAPGAAKHRDEAHALLDTLAGSDDWSPALLYEQVYYDVAGWLIRRGDRRGLTRQFEGMREPLETEKTANLPGAMRDLALFLLDLGDLREGLGLLSAMLRAFPGDPWGHNFIAVSMEHYGLPSLVRLAADRGQHVLSALPDPDQKVLARQLLEASRRTSGSPDTSHAPRDAIEDLADALRTSPGREPPDIAEFTMLHVPQAMESRLKQEPSMPPPSEMERVARRVHALRRARHAAGSGGVSTAPIVMQVTPQGAVTPSAVPKVGRNAPCACGSGKKYKRCHGA